MGHFRWQLTTSESGRTVGPSKGGMFMQVLGAIWELSDKGDIGLPICTLAERVMKSILITFGGGRAAIGIAKALKESPNPPRILATDSEKFALQRAIADQRFIAPRGDEPLYIPFLKKIIERTGVGMLWPVHESEIMVVSQNRTELGARVFLPDSDTILAGQNKMESYRLFSKAGVPVPEAIVIHDRDDLKAAFDSLGPDLWIRFTAGAGGKGALPVSDYKRAENWIEFHQGWGKFAAARNIGGGRWTSESIWFKGDLIAMQGRHNTMADLASLTPSGITGFTRAKCWSSDLELVEISQKAIKALSPQPHGIFGVDMVSDEFRNLFVTEVNVGRFSSGGFAHYRSGRINPAYTVLQLAYGEDPLFDPPLLNPFPTNETMIMGYGHEAVFVNNEVIAEQVREFEHMLASLET